MNPDLTILSDEDIENGDISSFFKSEKDYTRFMYYHKMFSAKNPSFNMRTKMDFLIEEIKEGRLKKERGERYLKELLRRTDYDWESCEIYCDQLIELGLEIKPSYIFIRERHNEKSLDYLLKYIDINTTNKYGLDIIMYSISIHTSLPYEKYIFRDDYKINKIDNNGKTLIDHMNFYIKHHYGSRFSSLQANKRVADQRRNMEKNRKKLIERGALKRSEIPVGTKTKGAKVHT